MMQNHGGLASKSAKRPVNILLANRRTQLLKGVHHRAWKSGHWVPHLRSSILPCLHVLWAQRKAEHGQVLSTGEVLGGTRPIMSSYDLDRSGLTVCQARNEARSESHKEGCHSGCMVQSSRPVLCLSSAL